MPAAPHPITITIDLLITEVTGTPRFDLGQGVYRAEVNGIVRFYRLDPLAIVPDLEDVTATCTATAKDRQRRAAAAQRVSAGRVLAQTRRVGVVAPVECRTRQTAGDVVEELADAAGVKRHRVRSPLQVMHGRGMLTGRQFSAGQALHQDWSVADGAREPGEGVPGMPSASPYGWDDRAVHASERLGRARRACNSITGLQVSAWSVVSAVVIAERTLAGVVAQHTASKRSEAAAPFRMALRAGLDAIGDVYGMPTERVTTKVFVGGLTVMMKVIEEADGTWRASELNGRPWHAEGKTAGEVYAHARTEMRRLVAEKLSDGPHEAPAIAAVLRAHREAAGKSADAARRAGAERRVTRLAEVVQERDTVLQSRAGSCVGG